MSWLQDFVESHLNFTGKCFHHCAKPTHMRIIDRASDRVIGAYVCPAGFVSQVVYFSTKPDLTWFQELLARQIGKRHVSKRDIRIASRHGWELGGEARAELQQRLGPEGKIIETYWTRYPKTPQQKQYAVSLCAGNSKIRGCMSLFVHNRRSNPTLCDKCKSKR